MVEKMDKVHGVPAWRVEATAQSGDQRRGGGQQEPHDDEQSEYSSPGTPVQWHKFHTQTADRQIVRVPREQIAHCWFRRVTLQRQIAVLEAFVELHGGTRYEYVQILLPRFDEYFHYKGYVVGQEIPLLTHLHEPVIELSVPRAPQATPAGHAAGPRRAAVVATPWWSVVDYQTDELRVGTLALYAAACLLLVLVVTLTL